MGKRAFIFPGQGAQIVGMGQDFYKEYIEAREIFDQADEVLGRKLSTIIFNGPLEVLTETRNSQIGIYITSLAILAVINKEFPDLVPAACAGLSLGEYTALAATGRIDPMTLLPIVAARGEYMNEACLQTKGTMAAIFGLSVDEIERVVKQSGDDLWVANFNCPGQTVISGTLDGVDRGIEMAQKFGAKRVIPLKVHGAFHSGLMKSAQEKLREKIMGLILMSSEIDLVMNVPGAICNDSVKILENLIHQMTHPVRWEQGVLAMKDINIFFEIGCGRVLSGLNKKIVPEAKTITINQIIDLKTLEKSYEGIVEK
ncbi:MAG: ACP S-malonyltransferase [Chlamydiia bacterium]|nr:ACP S-malonyltransferase [Chlamydiia bacterium]